MYYELAQIRVSARGKLIDAKDIRELVERKGLHQPLFRSVFWYDEQVIPYVRNSRSIASYRGLRGISEIAIDIDKSGNSDNLVLKKVREYIGRLNALGVTEESFQVYFSGTGYHIMIDNNVFGFTPGDDLPKIVGMTLHNLDLVSDPAVIRGTQLIRIEHSLNEKSGLYKIPLTYEEVTTLEASDILELAKTQRLDFEYPLIDGKFQLEKYIVSHEQLPDATLAVNKDSSFNSLYAVCIQKLWNQGPVEGMRNNAILRLASHFKRQGIPENATIYAMRGWNDDSLDEKIVDTRVRSVYSSPYKYGCSDTILSKYCKPNCIFYKNKSLEKMQLMNVEDLDKAMFERMDMIADMAANPINYINLKNIFGLDEDCMLVPGELVVFQGDTGTNKTSIIQNIMLGVDMVKDVVKPPGMSIIYYGPELNAGDIQMRNYSIVTGYTKDELIYHQEDLLRFKEALGHIAVQQGALTIAGIESLIVEYQPRVMVIDYYEQVEHPSWDRSPSIAVSEIAKALSAMAVKYNIIIIAISQVNRDAAKNGIGVHGGFGSGAIEKTARRLFVIEGKQDSPYRTISQVKANNDVTFANVVIERQDNWRFKRIN